jgi:unsaturated rhamnogalacturonyl hydrolase
MKAALLIIVLIAGCFLSAPAQVTVVLDDYFNHEIKKDKSGKDIVWHYKWDDTANSGFSVWGKIFSDLGAKTETLTAEPTAANLKNESIYIIVDPDTPQESPTPKYINAEDVKVLSDWVKKGGVLVLMGNDVDNCELDHFNDLVKPFGVQFNKDSKYRVTNNDYSMGRIMINAKNPVLKTARQLYLKEISTLSVSPPARTVLEADGNKIMASVKYGKGTVFVVGDPWLYNEYTNGRLPPEFENLKATADFSRWLIDQAKHK